MDKVIQVLEAQADMYYQLFKRERQEGQEEWAIKYEHMWMGVMSSINAVKELRDKAKKVPV